MDYANYKHVSDQKEMKQEQATIRQAEYDAMSTESKIAMLDKKFGIGLGAKKQRTKLATTV